MLRNACPTQRRESRGGTGELGSDSKDHVFRGRAEASTSDIRGRQRTDQGPAGFSGNTAFTGEDKTAGRFAREASRATRSQERAGLQESRRQRRELSAEIGDRRINRNGAGHP